MKDVKIPQIIGPRLMENRKPFNVRTLQLWYNIIHLAINVYLFHEAAMTGWLTGDNSYRCQPVDFSNTGMPYRVDLKHLQLNEILNSIPNRQIAQACWLYYLSKFTDFFETVTYVLMKRFDMINLYHVAHHR